MTLLTLNTSYYQKQIKRTKYSVSQERKNMINFTKKNTPSWVLSTFFFELHKWYQIAQSVSNVWKQSMWGDGSMFSIEKGCIGNEWVNEEEYLARHFQSNGVDNPYVDGVLSRANLFLTKMIWCFLCFLDIFCYLEHSPLWLSGSCLLGDCQLHNIDQIA